MSNDNWEVGDLALCLLDSSEWFSEDNPDIAGYGPTKGTIDRVIDVEVIHGCEFLELSRWPEAGFDSAHFRKINPHTPDEEDAETIRLLNQRPIRRPQRV